MIILYSLHYQKLEKAFKEYLVQLGYSQGKIRTLPSYIKEFLSKLEEEGIKELSQLSSCKILDYYHYLSHRPNKKTEGTLSARMVTEHFYAIRLLLNWQQEIGNLDKNPVSALAFPASTSNARTILTQKEISQLYEKTESLRDKAMLALFYGCGLRRAEAEKLNVQDIHFKTQILYVKEGKGGKRRAVPMSQKVADDLKNYYLYERPQIKDNPSFIVTSKGKRMKGDQYGKRLKEILKAARLNRAVCLHSLRHSIATHLLENGVAIEYVRDFLGHKHLEATQIYTRVNREQLRYLYA